MLNKIKAFIKDNNLIPDNSRILLALSGGVDSMTLLYILKELKYDIVVAHVNHKKRLESEYEERQIKELCNNLNIPCEILHLEHLDGNFQSKAHDKRYSFFINIAHKYNIKYIATAHHADDNIETILLNIMGGSNLYGYGGISKKLEINGTYIIRPLLLISKDDIKKYALKNNITYYEDISNSQDDYTRNRLRHHIIPVLKNECPSILSKISSYSNQIHEAFHFIRNISENFLNNYDNKINILEFNKQDLFIKKDIICLLLEKYEIERSENLINDLIDLIKNNKPQLNYSLKDNWIFKKRYNLAFIDNNILESDFKYILNNKEDKIDDNYIIYFSLNKPNDCANYIKLCYNEIVFPLTIRNRMENDEILMSFGHKKLKNLFIDKKIPKEMRERIPVVVDNLGNILWVVNYAKSKFVLEQKEKGNIYLVVKEK